MSEKLEIKTHKGIEYTFIEDSFCWKIFPKDIISPITIAVPHNGLEIQDLSGFFPKRKRVSEDGHSITIGVDRAVWSIVKGIAYGIPVNLVRGMFPRSVMDYNRYNSKQDFESYAGDLFEDTEEACDDISIKKYHQYYHNSLIELVLKSKEIYGSDAKFFDFHGFAKQPIYGDYDIIFGTANRKTIKSNADKALFEMLNHFGYSVFCQNEERVIPEQEDKFDAGFTTRNVFLKTGVDSIQIELYSSIRNDKEQAINFSENFSKVFSKSSHKAECEKLGLPASSTIYQVEEAKEVIRLSRQG